jgi:hypothetical protein
MAKVAALAGMAVYCVLAVAQQPAAPAGRATPGRTPAASSPAVAGTPAAPALDQADAQRTRDQLSELLTHYPPALHNILALDPGLLENQSYLAPYPGLAAFLNAHPEVARNPGFFIGEGPRFTPRDPVSLELDLLRDVMGGLAAFAAGGMAFGLLIWLVRTLIDYRRWSRLAKVQADVHAKLLDRFTANDDLVAYIQSPAGKKFLESAPIKLDAGPRPLSAPLGRILWSVQGGLVLAAAGVGLQLMGGRFGSEAAQPLRALGLLAVALGVGFLISAIISYVISRRLGLLEPPPSPALPPRMESPSA